MTCPQCHLTGATQNWEVRVVCVWLLVMLHLTPLFLGMMHLYVPLLCGCPRTFGLHDDDSLSTHRQLRPGNSSTFNKSQELIHFVYFSIPGQDRTTGSGSIRLNCILAHYFWQGISDKWSVCSDFCGFLFVCLFCPSILLITQV